MKRLLLVLGIAVIFIAGTVLGYKIFPMIKPAPAPAIIKPIAPEPIKPSTIGSPAPATVKNVPVPPAVPLVPVLKPTPPVVVPPPQSEPVPASPPPATAGRCAVPSGAGAEDVSKPTTVIGDGTAASCTAAKVVDAVHKGGVATFNCGGAHD